MMELFAFVSNIITGGIRIVACLLLIYRILNVGIPDKKCTLISFTGTVTITIFLSLFPLSNLFRIVLEVIWITGSTYVFHKVDIRMSLFISIFFEIATSFWLFLICSGTGILFHSAAFLDGSSLWGQISIWVLNILLILFLLYMSKRTDITAKEAFRLATTIALAGFIALIALSEQTELVIPEDALDTWMLLSIILMTSMLIFNIRHQYEVEKELARSKSMQAELLERDYITLNNVYTDNAKLFHDFHNHIGALRHFLIHEKYTQALEYLAELQEPLKGITDTIWTGDETVDYLINSKMKVAADNHMHLQVQVEFPRHANIRSADLCAILGNLLDNALEGTKKITDPGQRTIQLTIRRINQMLVIKVENPLINIPFKENGYLKTSKTGKGLHGWGLKSAQAAAEKYDGMVRTAYEDGIFRAVATLSYLAISNGK